MLSLSESVFPRVEFAARSERVMPFPGAQRRRPSLISAAIAAPPPPVVDSRSRSPYEVLRVKPNASQGEIKAAYRKLAKIYHPDASARFDGPSSDGRLFVEIRNAYATLSDPGARALYDQKLRMGRRSWDWFSGYGATSCPTRRWESEQCW